MKKNIYFDPCRFRELSDQLLSGEIENEATFDELVSAFSQSISTDVPDDEVFQSLISADNSAGFDIEEAEDDLIYIEDDFEDFDDIEYLSA